MKKLLIGSCLLLMTLFMASCSTSPVAVTPTENDVIGTVNGENVYRYEYDYFFNMFFNEYFTNYYDNLLSSQGIDMLNEDSSRTLLGNMENFAWQSVVQAELVRQMATQDYGISLDPVYFDNLLTPAYALSIRTNRLYDQLTAKLTDEAKASKQVTEADAKAKYDSDPTAWDCRKVAHIIITAQQMKDEDSSLDDDAAKAAALARAKDIIAQLKAGGDFAALAAQYSSDSSAQNGGVMDLYFNINGGGVSDQTSFDPLFAAGAFQLANVGDFSDEPVESSFGYHIIKLLDKKEGFDAVKDYVIASLQAVDSNEVNQYFQQKLQTKQDAATIERTLEFKYYTEPQDNTATDGSSDTSGSSSDATGSGDAAANGADATN